MAVSELSEKYLGFSLVLYDTLFYDPSSSLSKLLTTGPPSFGQGRFDLFIELRVASHLPELTLLYSEPVTFSLRMLYFYPTFEGYR